MMFALLKNIKSKLMTGVAFVLFFSTSVSRDGRSYTISVIIESHAERIFMRKFLIVILLFIEVVVNFPYPLLFIRCI